MSGSNNSAIAASLPNGFPRSSKNAKPSFSALT
jgi:hypothetical protein